MSLRGFEYAASARRDVVRVVRVSNQRFGTEAARRYGALIRQAITDLVDDPERLGTREIDGRLHYHLRNSRNHVTGGWVREPRHILVCKIRDDILYVLAIAHDAMEERMARRIEEGESS